MVPSPLLDEMICRSARAFYCFALLAPKALSRASGGCEWCRRARTIRTHQTKKWSAKQGIGGNRTGSTPCSTHQWQGTTSGSESVGRAFAAAFRISSSEESSSCIFSSMSSLKLPMKGQYTRTSPDSVRIEENIHPLSTWTGVESAEDLSTNGEFRRNGRPHDVKVHT